MVVNGLVDNVSTKQAALLSPVCEQAQFPERVFAFDIVYVDRHVQRHRTANVCKQTYGCSRHVPQEVPQKQTKLNTATI